MYMKLNTLLEMPRIISDLKFSKNLDLDNISVNNQYYKKLKNRYTKQLKTLDENIVLYSTKKNEFFVLDNEKQEVLYYLIYNTVDISLINSKLIYQSCVWRSPGNISVAGIASNIFWNYLFEITGYIITDGLQTNKGRRFWTYRIQEALTKNINVYYIDLHDESTLLKIENSRDFSNISSDLYGNTIQHEDRKIIITKYIIDQF